MKTKTTTITMFYYILATVSVFFSASSFAQDEDTTKKVNKFKALSEKAASTLSNKPYFWKMTMTAPVEIVSDKVEFPYKDEDVSLVIWFNHGAGKMGIQGPDHICIDLINVSNDTINVKWDEAKITNLKGDGVRNQIKQMYGSSVYSPKAQSVDAGEKVQFCFSVSHCIKTYHHNGHYNELGEWIEAWDQLDDFRIFCQGDCDPDVADAGTNLEKMKLAVVGKEFSIYLPMEINGKKVTKTFSFRVEDVKEWKE